MTLDPWSNDPPSPPTRADVSILLVVAVFAALLFAFDRAERSEAAAHAAGERAHYPTGPIPDTIAAP